MNDIDRLEQEVEELAEKHQSLVEVVEQLAKLHQLVIYDDELMTPQQAEQEEAKRKQDRKKMVEQIKNHLKTYVEN